MSKMSKMIDSTTGGIEANEALSTHLPQHLVHISIPMDWLKRLGRSSQTTTPQPDRRMTDSAVVSRAEGLSSESFMGGFNFAPEDGGVADNMCTECLQHDTPFGIDETGLANLWEAYVSSPTKSSDMFRPVSDHLRSKLQSWHPETDPTAIPGHPSGVVIVACREFKKTTRFLQTSIQRAESGLSAGTTVFREPAGRESLELVVLLARSAKNRDIMQHHDIVKPLISLLKLSTTKLSLMCSTQSPFSPVASRIGHHSSVSRTMPSLVSGGVRRTESPLRDERSSSGISEYRDAVLIFLQKLIADSLHLIQLLCDDMSEWRNSIDMRIDPHKPRQHAPSDEKAANTLLSQGIMSILTDVVRVVRAAYQAQNGLLTPIQLSVQTRALECIGAILNRLGAPAQTKLREIGCLEAVVGLLGWPRAGITAEGTPQILDEKRCHQEYEQQITCLSVLCVAGDGSSENARRITALGGLEKLIDFALWMAAEFSTTHRDIDVEFDRAAHPTDICKCDDVKCDSCSGVEYTLASHVYSRNTVASAPDVRDEDLSRELSVLFGVIHALCLTGGQRSRGRYAGVNASVLQAILDIFNNGTRHTSTNSVTRSRLLLLPELQLHVVNLVTRLLTQHPKPLAEQILTKLRDIGIWRVLLGTYFFIPASKIEEMEQSDEAIETDIWPKIDQKWASHLFGRIKAHSLQLALHVATVPVSAAVSASGGNIAECGRLLELLREHGTDDASCCEVGQALVTLLQSNRDLTHASLLKLDTLQVLRYMVEHHRAVHARFCRTCAQEAFLALPTIDIDGEAPVIDVDGNVPFDTVDQATLFHVARSVTLRLLDTFLRSESANEVAMRDPWLIRTFFALMVEPSSRSLITVRLCDVMQAAPSGSEDAVAVFRSYLDLLPRLCERASASDAHFQFLLILIAGLRRILERHTKRHQKTLRELGAFIKIVTVLNTDLTDADTDTQSVPKARALLHEVLHTLTKLLARSSKNKAAFREFVGYDQLRALLLRAEANHPCDETMRLLFEMLVDGEELPNKAGEIDEVTEGGDTIASSFGADKPRHTIANPDVIQVLFGALLQCDDTIKKEMLVRYIELVRDFTVNLSHSCSAGLIAMLLDMVPSASDERAAVLEQAETAFVDHTGDLLDLILSLVEILGAHSITVKELKIMFLLLRERSDGTRPAYTAALLRCLQNMTRRQGPEVFFDFDGRQSALVLPKVDDWPPQRGYTFSTWLRIESFEDPGGKPAYEPRLFSFLTEDMQGMECYFEPIKHQLVMEVTAKARREAVSMPYEFETKRWYFVVVTHSLGRWPAGIQEARLYVDGELAAKQQIKYPTVVGVPPPPFTKCRIGSSAEFTAAECAAAAELLGERDNFKSTARYREMPFFGQLGAVYFFDEVITPAFVHGLHALGPNYMDIFHPAEAEGCPSESDVLFDGTLMGNVLLAYNSKSAEGKFCLDNSPPLKRSPTHARLVGMTPSVTRDVRDTIHCLGGVPVVFPLLLQLDLSIEGSTQAASDPSLCQSILALLGEMLRESRTNQDEMGRVHGFHVVPHLLMQINPANVTGPVLGVFAELAELIHTTNRRLFRDILEGVFMDFRLVSRCSVSTQIAWANLLGDLASIDASYFRETLHGVQHVIDILRLFLWYDVKAAFADGYGSSLYGITVPESASKSNPEPELQYPRPSDEDLRIVRWSLMDALTKIVQSRPTAEEVGIVLAFLDHCTDWMQVEDLLVFIVGLIRGETGAPFSVAVVQNNGPATLLNLMKSPRDPVREAAIAALAALLDRSRNALTLFPVNTGAGAAVLADALSGVPLSSRIYTALLLLALGREIAVMEVEKPIDGSAQDDTRMPGHSYSNFTVVDMTKQQRRRPRAMARGGDRRVTLRWILSGDAPNLDFNKSLEMRFPSVALTILSLVQIKKTPTSLRLRALQDLLLLLNHSPKNCRDLARVPGWESVVLNVMGAQSAEAGRTPSTSESIRLPNPSSKLAKRLTMADPVSQAAREEYRSIGKGLDMDAEAVHDLVMRVLQLLHLGALEEESCAWQKFEQELASLQLFADDKMAHMDPGSAVRRVLNDQIVGVRAAFERLDEQAKAAKRFTSPSKSKVPVGLPGITESRTLLQSGPQPAAKVPAIFENTTWLVVMVTEQIMYRASELVESLGIENANGATGAGMLPLIVECDLRRGPKGEWMDLDLAGETLKLISTAGLRELCHVVTQSSDRVSSGSALEQSILRLTTKVIVEDWMSRGRLHDACKLLIELLDYLASKSTGDWDRISRESLPYALWHTMLALGLASAENETDIVTDDEPVDVSVMRSHSGEAQEAPTWRGHVYRLRTGNSVRGDEAFDGIEQPKWRVTLVVNTIRRILRTHRAALSLVLTDADGEGVLDPLSVDDTRLSPDSQPDSFLELAAGDVRWRYAVRRALPAACSSLLHEEELRGPSATALGVRWTLAKVEVRTRQREESESAATLQSETVEPLETVFKERSWNELHRVQESALQILRERRRVALRQWRRVLRIITTERGAWGKRANEDDLHWKLDNHEDRMRRRKRLKRNFYFDPHTDASRRRDADKNKDAPVEPEPEPETKTAWAALITPPAVDDGEVGEGDQDDGIDDGNGEAGVEGVSADSETVVDKEKEKEKVVFGRTYCEMVTPVRVVPGWIEITTHFISFYAQDEEELGGDLLMSAAMIAQAAASSWAKKTGVMVTQAPAKDRKWSLEDISGLHPRRYLLCPSAIEIFLTDGTNYLLNFDKKTRNKVFDKIIGLDCPNLVRTARTRSPRQWLRKSGLTQRWQRREISNFEYLMHLNTIAGRTYNDLTQYPVFPWVISDYESPTINLDDPGVYRDLSRPIGALNESRLNEFLERFQIWDDPIIPPFMYGTHYSTAAIVLYYMIRIESFTSLFIQHQGGQFDHADRMFDSVIRTWNNALSGTADVRELIPEWYYMPELFVNSNKFDLGTKQTGEKIDAVALPPWASSPEEFVQISANALESEVVSAHLNEWIDLIFGYKQRDHASVDANNVFYYLTYEGSVDIDKIDDPHTRMATISQIQNFGQTPTQLSRRPHPKRHTALDPTPLPANISTRPEELKAFFLQISTAPVVFVGVPPTQSIASLLFMGVPNRVVTVDRLRILAAHRWLPKTPNAQGSPFTFEFDPNLTSRHSIGVAFAPGVTPGPHCMCLTSDGRALLSCGYWDNTFKVHLCETSRLSQSIRVHKDAVTCLSLTDDGTTLVTGSRDTTCMVWSVSYTSGVAHVVTTPRAVLYGHDDEVTCVSVSSEHDVVVSVSLDGTCVVHTMHQGRYIRSIRASDNVALHRCLITPDCNFLLYSSDDLMLRIYSPNGNLLNSVDAQGRINSMAVSAHGCHVVTGGERGICALRKLPDLKLVHKYSVDRVVHCVMITSDETQIMAGTQDGKLLVFAAPTD